MFSDLLGRLPPDVDLDVLAVQTKAIERKRKIGDGASLLRMALARGPGGLSLSQTAAWASMLGMARLSDPAVKFRLDKAGDFLAAIVEHALAGKTDGPAVLWPGRVLRVADGSHVNQPASKGTDWHIHGVLDLSRGGFSHLALTDNHVAESIGHGAPLAGEVRICDRNYARAGKLQRFRAQSGDQADFIVRMSWRAFRLTRSDGEIFDLITHLRRLPDDHAPHEVAVWAATDRGQPPLPLRLIILRRPKQATEATRRHLIGQAPRKQKKLDPRSLVAAEFLILATSLPAEPYPADGVLAAYRLRWQIELAFKRLKSLLHIDRLPTHTPAASRSWLLAHLSLALLCDDLSQEFLESSP
jgi:Transposase DDE domain